MLRMFRHSHENCVVRRSSVLVPAVIQALLLRYAERPPLPARSPLWIPPELPKGGAVMRFVRTAAGESLLRATSPSL